MGREKRTFARLDCQLELSIVKPGRKLRAFSHDISLGGLRLECGQLRQGDPLEISLEGHRPVRGEVRWTRLSGMAGVQFVGDLPKILDTWVGEVLARFPVDYQGLFN